MRISPRLWRGLALVALAVAVLLVVVKVWVVPAVIAGQIRSAYGGDVAVGGWWANGSSAGVTDLVLHEGPDAASPVLARADRVTTDLSLGSLLRGNFLPRTIRLEGPEVTIRLDRDGQWKTKLPAGGGSSRPLPAIVVEDGRLTFEQEGRDDMVVTGLKARLQPDSDASTLTAEADDPTWGRLHGSGTIASDFSTMDVKLWSESLVADPKKARSLPFVPAETWDHVLPTGPVDVVLTFRKAEGATSPLAFQTVVQYQQTDLKLPTLGLDASKTTGRMVVENGIVHLEDMKGASIGGQVTANGALDFVQEPPKIDLDLGLHSVDVAHTPKSWQLDEAGLTGKLDGRAHLIVYLTKDGADLSGSSGEAVLTGGTIGEIPFKSLKLTMRAEGNNLQYQTGSSTAAWLDRWVALHLVAFQSTPDAPKPAPQPPKADAPQKGGLILPKTISTEIEFEDVDLTQVLARGEALGLSLPFVLAGKLSLKASATIPLGKLRDVKAYVFHGEATLKGAHVAGVDLGRLTARLDLENGILELSQLKGQLVNMPSGGLKNRPQPTVDIADEGPLPAGGFRGRLRAELSPLGKLTAHLEGNALPLGEIAAPALPKPTPLGGLVDLNLDVSGDLERATDPKSWMLDGRIDSREITYREATLDAIVATVTLQQGRFEVSDLSATLAGEPLKAKVGVTLEKPYPFEGTLDVKGWDLTKLLALVPGIPRPSPVDGLLTAEATARGDLQPLRLQSQGHGTLGRFRTGPVTWGEVPVRWETSDEAMTVSIVEAHPFGGTLTAEARVPTHRDGPITGSATLQKIDTAAVAKAIPGEALQLSGEAGGRVTFTIRPRAAQGTAPIEADLRLDAPDLAVQGIPASAVQAAVTVDRGVLHYDLYAESLGGKIKLQGEIPLAEATTTEARLQAVRFTLREDVWQALGVTGALAKLRGQGALDANVRLSESPPEIWARGVAEFRELRWGPEYLIGRLQGIFALAPESWQIRSLNGELFGGTASGEIEAGPPSEDGDQPLRFRFQIDRAALDRIAAIEPGLAQLVEGYAMVRLAGQMGEALRATGEIRVPVGRLALLPLHDLHAPMEITYIPSSSVGTLESRRWTTHLAGGQVQGNAHFRFGLNRAFQTELRLSDVELETLSRAYTDQTRPASGKVSGLLTLRGLDTLRPQTYKGRAELDLTDASVLDLPVFRAFDRFLGGPAGGGVFELGHISAAISNRQVVIEELYLLGRVAQLHVRGTVGFNTDLDLVVLINTNQIIPQTGQALLGIIPGLRDTRGSAASLQVSNFLSNRLIKLRVGGTLRNPSVALDPTATVSNAAVGFFAGALKLPLGLFK